MLTVSLESVTDPIIEDIAAIAGVTTAEALGALVYASVIASHSETGLTLECRTYEGIARCTNTTPQFWIAAETFGIVARTSVGFVMGRMIGVEINHYIKPSAVVGSHAELRRLLENGNENQFIVGPAEMKYAETPEEVQAALDEINEAEATQDAPEFMGVPNEQIGNANERKGRGDGSRDMGLPQSENTSLPTATAGSGGEPNGLGSRANDNPKRRRGRPRKSKVETVEAFSDPINATEGTTNQNAELAERADDVKSIGTGGVGTDSTAATVGVDLLSGGTGGSIGDSGSEVSRGVGDRGSTADESSTDEYRQSVERVVGKPKKAADDPLSLKSGSCVLVFPTRGPLKEFVVSSGFVEKLEEMYSPLDVMAEIRRAYLWVAAKPDRRKTARGMPAFLTSWLGRACDRGGSSIATPGGQERRRAFTKEMLDRLAAEGGDVSEGSIETEDRYDPSKVPF